MKFKINLTPEDAATLMQMYEDGELDDFVEELSLQREVGNVESDDTADIVASFLAPTFFELQQAMMNLREGSIHETRVVRVAKQGITVSFDDVAGYGKHLIEGFIKQSHLPEEHQGDPSRHYHVGRKIKVVVRTASYKLQEVSAGATRSGPVAVLTIFFRLAEDGLM